MATIGDLVRLDSNGRFTTTGAGSTMRAEVERRAEENRKLEQIKLVDARGFLCTYITHAQLSDIGLPFKLNKGVATLEAIQSSDSRLRLLRLSYANPALSPENNVAVSEEINRVLSPRLHNYPKPSEDMLITRDAHGLFVGMHTEKQAARYWKEVKKQGPIIVIERLLSLKEVSGFAAKSNTSNISYSSQVEKSVSRGREFSISLGRRKQFNGRDRMVVNVMYRDDLPICAIPQEVLQGHFGSSWFLADRTTAQLVLDWDPDKVAQVAKEAQTAAGHAYVMSGAGVRAKRLKLKDSGNSAFGEDVHPKLQAQRTSVSTKKMQLEEHAIARDLDGLYLGVFTLEDARARWVNASREGSVILVHKNVPVEEAASSALEQHSPHASLSREEVQHLVTKSRSFVVSNHVEDEAFREGLRATLLRVLNLAGDEVATLNIDQLNRAFGHEWILVSADAAMLSSSLTRQTINTRIKRAKKTTGKTAGHENVSKNESGRSQEKKASASPAQVMSSIGISQETASTILEQVRMTARGYRTKLFTMVKLAFPNDEVSLPSGNVIKTYSIPEALAGTKGLSLSADDMAFVLIAIDRALARKERESNKAKQAHNDLATLARKNKHAILAWSEAVLADMEADQSSRELASVFHNGGGTVLVMIDDALYRSVLNTDLDEAAYNEALEIVPFTHFAVRTPRIKGVYGFGVIRREGGKVSILPIEEHYGRGRELDMLEKYFRRVLFFICANRDLTKHGYRIESAGSDVSQIRRIPVAQTSRKPNKMDEIVKGSVFELGMRVVFFQAGKDFRESSASTRDVRPHAVAGTTYYNSNGVRVTRRPHWNHGAGKKRDSIPPEIVERDVRYRY